jgi:FtsP/CotA-like multicopper oxidase with cupredoxin domain
MDMGGGMGGMSGSAGVSFRINGEAYPNITPVRTHMGAVEVWDVVNDTEMDHPFHLHGFFFQPLTLNGAPVERQWKDTMNVPQKQTLRLAVRFDDHAGSFMFHCHILEHAELGMMGELLVESP